MDNRVFDVNGETKEGLQLAIRLAFSQIGSYAKVKYWTFDKEFGLILLMYTTGNTEAHELPVELGADATTDLAWAWLTNSDQPKEVMLTDWFADIDVDIDMDGSTSLGWRAYVGDWGRVKNHHGTVIVISPAYLWRGK